MSIISELNKKFAIPSQLTFEEGEGGFIMATVSNAFADAEIALQGAHILNYSPKNDAPVIWLSPRAKFAVGKAVRGGVPICWPWFGNHDTEPSYPAHGIARTAMWDVTASEKLEDGSICITFELQISDAAKAMWPHPSRLQNIVTVGRDLIIELVTHNTGSSPFTIGEALHTYFVIGDIETTTVSGLAGCEYIDKVDHYQRKTEPGKIKVTSEVDRVYLNTQNDCVITDNKLHRSIVVSKSGSDSTVVWNPWAEKAAQMADVGEGNYMGMLCVESANAADNVVTVAPGEVHSMRVVYMAQRG